ncbi:MAG: UDP-N-acetylmuramoyl-L-alanine--D-glutamate ligase [Parcubacteria group bacterium]
MNKPFPDFKNKKILILGLGLLGRGIKDAIFFAEAGAEVTVTDMKNEVQLQDAIARLKKYPIKYSLGGHKNEDILNADLIIRNAGVPRSSPFLKLAADKKIPVEMDESLFARYCPCPIVGVTGTRGKSTTTVLIGKILKNRETAKRKIYVSGNLQGEATLPLIGKVRKEDIVVLELSSWQLQGFAADKISPRVAVFTNVFPDHLNSYADLEEYIADKKYIFQFQKKSDWCVLNAENSATKKMARKIRSRVVLFSKNDIPENWHLKLKGEHNRENAAAAKAVGRIFKVPEDAIRKTISEFAGLEHRLEFVKKINSVAFVNDTTSTTPVAGEKALDSIEGPVIISAGGATKNLDLGGFAKAIAEKAKAVVLLEGTATDELEEKIRNSGGGKLLVGRFGNFQEAIERAYRLSLPGDTVLLSPGCASFGMFANEFDRGEQFKKIVNNL